MKFELNPYNRNVSDTDFLNDLKRVASDMKKDSLSVEEYGKNGKYHPSTIQRRFGSWTKATELAGLQIRKNPKLSGDDLIEDLKRVASVLNKKTITQNEYKSLGKYDSAPLVRVFGSWFGALEKAGLERSRTLGVTNEEYFENLEEIWTKLGRQPKYAEMEKPFSKYSAGAYERRFGSWREALEAFIKYINEEDERLITEGKIEPDVEQNNTDIQTIQHKTKRNINWRLRFIIMKRDNFKCLKCGRSPSSDSSVVLHVDHIKPYSKGGETIIEDLETLCMVCNIGKSSLE